MTVADLIALLQTHAPTDDVVLFTAADRFGHGHSAERTGRMATFFVEDAVRTPAGAVVGIWAREPTPAA